MVIAQGSGAGGTSYNYSSLGSTKVKNVISTTERLLQDYIETVCKEFLKTAEVSSHYNGPTTRVLGHKDTVEQSVISSQMSLLKSSTDKIISKILNSGPLTDAGILGLNSSIVSALKQSAIYVYYYNMNWLKKLDERMVGLYGR